MAIEANDQGAAALIPHWMVNGIGAMKEKLVLANLIQRDSGPNPEEPFNQLNVPVRGVLTARSKAEGSPIISDSPVNSNIPIILAHHDYVSWAYEDTAKAKMSPAALQYFMDAVIGVSRKIETRCADLYAGLSTVIGAAATPLDESSILAAKAALGASLCPEEGRFAFISEDEETRLVQVDKLSRADARGNGGQVMTEGKVGRLYGFDVYGSQLVSKTVGPPIQTHNIVGHPMFAIMAMRPLPIPDTTVSALYIYDEQTGLSFRYMWGYSMTEQTTIHTIDVLYGLAVVDPRLALELRS